MHPDMLFVLFFMLLVGVLPGLAFAVSSYRTWLGPRFFVHWLSGLFPAARVAFFEQMADGMLIIDRRQRIVVHNRQAERILWHAAAASTPDLMGVPVTTVLPALTSALQREDEHIIMQVNLATSGAEPALWVQLALTRLSRRQHTLGWLIVLHDITGRLQTETHLQQREQALQVREETFHAFFEQSQDGLILVDEQGMLIEWSGGSVRLFGRDRRDVLGRPFWDVLYESAPAEKRTSEIYTQVKARTLQFIERAGTSDTSSWQGEQFQRRLHRPDGSYRVVSAHVFPISTNGKRLLGGIIRDITDLVQSEEALRTSETRYRLLADYASDMISCHTPEGIYTYVSPVCTTLLGYSSDELIGCSAYDLFHPNDVPAITTSHNTIATEPIIYTVSYRIRRKDGSYTWFETTSKTVHDPESGALQEIIAVSRDISERRRAEEALRQSEETFRTLVGAMDDIVFTLDREQRHTGVFGRWMERYGLTADFFLGKTSRETSPTQEVAALHEAANARALAGESLTYVWSVGDPPVYVQTSLSPICNSQGQVTGLVGVGRDVTPIKQSEVLMQQAKEAAEAANRAKSSFLANMSHELRTPLNAILGFTQLMEYDDRIPPDVQRNLHIISHSGEHLLMLINDILDMSKIEAGRSVLQENEFDLHGMIRDLANMFRLRANQQEIQLRIEQEPGIPPYVRTDEKKLRQVLINLLSNAVKFTHEGSVRLHVGLSQEAASKAPANNQDAAAEQQCSLFFEVKDTGIGIAPEHLEHIFDAFTQEVGRPQSPEGTGLGLSISQHFVRMMGGTLNVQSEPGSGSSFFFTIPVHIVAALEQQRRLPRRRVVGIAPGQPTYRIMVVEDRLASRTLLVQLLRPFGFEVSEATNGREALELWEHWRPHLVFMDMRMPVMDGYEATSQIRSSTRGQSVAIVALTASAFEEDRNIILSMGCDAFIRKPFRTHEIFEVLTSLLGVEWEYAESTEEDEMLPALPVVVPGASLLTTETLAALPAEWVTQLHRAALLGNRRAILHLSTQMRDQVPRLAEELRGLAQEFRFEQITAVTGTLTESPD